MEPMEPRLLYSAEAAPLLAFFDPENQYPTVRSHDLLSVSDFDQFPNTEFLNLTSNISTSAVTEVVLVDSSHPDIAELQAQLQRDLKGNEQTVIIRLSVDDDPLNAIREALSRYDDLQAVHIVSHAIDGAIQLGNQIISHNDLLNNKAIVAQWGESLHADGDILLYGCNLSATDDGRLFAQTLSTITSADVASSSDTLGILDGLVHHWKFDGNGNDLVGGATMTLHNNLGMPTGILNNAADFNEPSGNIKYGEVGAGLYSAFNQNDFSISLWMHGNSVGPNSSLMSNIELGSTGYSLSVNANGYMEFSRVPEILWSYVFLTKPLKNTTLFRSLMAVKYCRLVLPIQFVLVPLVQIPETLMGWWMIFASTTAFWVQQTQVS